jgi:hypothetical protein
VSRRQSRLQRTRERIAAQVEAAVAANPDTTLVDEFEGFWGHLAQVSSSPEAAEREARAQVAIRERDERIRRRAHDAGRR